MGGRKRERKERVGRQSDEESDGGREGSRKEGERTLTRAPMTPREVSRRYSKGRVLLVVLRKG